MVVGWKKCVHLWQPFAAGSWSLLGMLLPPWQQQRVDPCRSLGEYILLVSSSFIIFGTEFGITNKIVCVLVWEREGSAGCHINIACLWWSGSRRGALLMAVRICAILIPLKFSTRVPSPSTATIHIFFSLMTAQWWAKWSEKRKGEKMIFICWHIPN